MKFRCPKCKARITVKPKAQIEGGKLRWAKLTKEQRSEAARNAALARWAKKGNQ